MDGNADFSLIGQMEELLSNMDDDGLSTSGSSRRSSLDSFEGVRLESGIYLVRNRTCSEDSGEDFPVLVDRGAQMADGIGDSDSKHDEISDANDDQDATGISVGEVQSGMAQYEETQEETTDLGVTDDEDVAVESVDIEEEEEEGQGHHQSGPAGINWQFGHGRLTLCRQNSLLEEIAQVKY